jgi:RNA polymerase sigma-70 factor (ECF subfamily)
MEDLNAALDRSLIRDALARLSPQHRAVIRRSYYLGWTTARIADDLNIADDTVKSRLHHAMRVLLLATRVLGPLTSPRPNSVRAERDPRPGGA